MFRRCVLTILCLLWLPLQLDAQTPSPCSLTMTSYNPQCSGWVILSVVAFMNSSETQVTAARIYLTNVTNNCGGNSQMKIFLPQSQDNENANLCQFGTGYCRDSLQDIDVSAAALPTDYPKTHFETLLTYLANLAIATPTNAGTIFIFTDLNCYNMASFLDSFVNSVRPTSYNLKFFFYDDGSCTMTCGYSNGCDIVFGPPVPNGEHGEQACKVAVQTGDTPEPTGFDTTTVVSHPPWKPDDSFPTTLQLALIIGIPSLALVILCAICACCCCKCMDVKKHQTKAFLEHKGRGPNFEDWKHRFFSRKNKGNADPSAPVIEICEDGVPIAPPANFAVSNHYMDLAHLAKRNKKDYWEFQSKNLIIHDNEVLGAGAFATVYRATVIGKVPLLKAVTGVSAQLENTQDGRCDAAVKRLPGHADEQNRKDFFHEMEFMKRLGYHAHLIAMLGCISDAWDPLIVVEYCQYGDLLRFIRGHRNDFFGASSSTDTEKSKTILTIKNLVSFAWQISDGMSYLSSRNFVHRDLAARNVLVTKNLVMKVSDFGLCRYTDQALYTAKGGKLPIKWMSTEALKFGEFSPKSDVWAFGVTLWELFSLGEAPYNAVQPTDMLIHLEDGNRLLKPQFCPNEIRDVMTSTWDVDSVRRPTFEEIRAKLTVMLNFNDESYGYLTVVHKEADKSTCAVGEEKGSSGGQQF